jgi:small subunit ribosomal protein S2
MAVGSARDQAPRPPAAVPSSGPAPFMETVTVKQLIDAGVHFGCRVSRWNPKMAPYIYGRRNLIHIMDLRETLRGLLRAQNFLYHIAAEGQQILWVGTKRQVKGVIHDAGQRTGMPVVTERWIGGTLTNFSVIRSRLKRLEELETMEEDGTLAAHSKKMVSTLRRERRKIERNLGGIREMSSIPGATVVVDPAREVNAVREARRLGIPVIGILDSDCDPSLVDIVIPGNDDALKSVRLLLERLVTAVEEGCANRRESVASMGRAEKSEEALAPSDEPRPTRGNVPPPGLRSRRPVPALRGLKPGGEEDEEGLEEPLEPAPEAPRAAEPEPEPEKESDSESEEVAAEARSEPRRE